MKKQVLITGGTKGIGKAVALSLGKAGYNLILTYASDEGVAKNTREEIRLLTPVDVFLLKADITKQESVEDVYSFLAKNNLSLDAIVFNAGLTCRDSFENIQMEDWERVFFGNVHFPVFLLQRTLSLINKGGSIVFTGSAMGIYPHSVSLAYGVTKSAIHSLVKNLVKFLAPYGIRVNGIAPGFVDTEWQKTKPLEIRRNIENKVALGRFCEPEELAEVYKMVIENRYLNSEIIVVDGGYSYK
ncbi:MAG: SDR family oxidoreductase [Tannerellaceae bacterium]|jgi:3-oxoacyl-[acyl-carrier protein] reductase|nr:SDR family oxidoreductase [Tannerellaceae bacterium]